MILKKGERISEAPPTSPPWPRFFFLTVEFREGFLFVIFLVAYVFLGKTSGKSMQGSAANFTILRGTLNFTITPLRESSALAS